MKNAICDRPNAKTHNIWTDNNGTDVVGPAHNELVTITERKTIWDTKVVRLLEYVLPNSGWWQEKCFPPITSVDSMIEAIPEHIIQVKELTIVF